MCVYIGEEIVKHYYILENINDELLLFVSWIY